MLCCCAVKMKKNLYIDNEGVKRGFYVYLHKDNATGEVFYVGKGSKKRAWADHSNNKLWKDKVESLSEGWSVKIVKDDLSEYEALELEGKLIEHYGGAHATGGKLTNWGPGDHSLEVFVHHNYELHDEWEKKYYEVRQFKHLSREEQLAITKHLTSTLGTIDVKLIEIIEKTEDEENEDLLDSAEVVENTVSDVLSCCEEILNYRISWTTFGIRIEEAFDDLDSEMEELSEHHEEIKPFLKQSYELVRDIYTSIDSGNREEAEEYASM